MIENMEIETDQEILRNRVLEKLGITQIQASKEIGINLIYLNKWLNKKGDLGALMVIKINEWLEK